MVFNTLELRWHMDPRMFAAKRRCGYFFIEFYMDGISLIERLLDCEDEFWPDYDGEIISHELATTFYGKYAGLIRVQHYQKNLPEWCRVYIDMFCLRIKPEEGPDQFEKATIYGCSGCSGPKCSVVSADIIDDGDGIVWKNFGPHWEPVLSAMPEFRFDREHYMREFNRIDDMVSQLDELWQQQGSDMSVLRREEFYMRYGEQHQTNY